LPGAFPEQASAGGAYKLAVSLFIVSILAAQVWAILAPREDWPFGANAMFAYDVSLQSPLYDVAFFVRPSGESWRRLHPVRDLATREVILKRKFFSRYFVSANPRFTQRPPAGGTPGSRRDRLTAFATRIADAFADRGRPLDALRIELVRLDPAYQPVDRHVVFELGFGERP
jgi:hypothetical protein